MQVSLRHTYYNAARGECADFDISPTPTTATLMRDLGLLYRYEGAGFSVLYDEARTDVLLNYLARQREPDTSPRAGQCWARLSFVLALNNPYFVNFTDIPIDVNPAEENFYFTNRKAHADDLGRVVLNPGDEVTHAELLSVVSTQVKLHLARGSEAVLARDISGAEVIEPTCGPPGEKDARLAPARAKDDTRIVYLDFSQLPEDKYLIQVVEANDCENVRLSDKVVRQWRVLYTTPAPVPLCFIDLLFTDPTGKGRGIYPVTYPDGPSQQGEIVPVHYELRFGARATYWNYFVVPQPQTESFEGLRIESVSQPPVEFAGPCCVRLSNGARAYRFCSKRRLRLRQQSEYNFRLLGRHGLMTHEGALVARLPVASCRQVLPLSAEDASAALSQSLCPDVEPDGRCLELIDLLCPPAAKGREAGPPRDRSPTPATHNYSDTYVYI
jgi:hypothetical protein